MSRRDVICGIDVGSSNIRTVVVQLISSEEKPRIIGVGASRSLGVRKGVIVDIEETLKSIGESVEKAERTAGVEVRRAIVSIGGNHISSQPSRGVVAVNKVDGEVTNDDVERVIAAAQAISVPLNKEIIHIVPRNYSLDDQRNIKDPVGMNGVRLEVDALIFEGLTPYIKNLSKCFDLAKIDIENFVFTPLAASKAVLTKRQKELGVILIDIGGGTTSIAVFEEDDLLASLVIPIGGAHITNDIAIGLRTSVDVAEKVKLEFGNALPREISKKEDINLAEIDSNEEGIVSRHHVAEIIEARLEEIFNLVDKELKAIGKDKLLPAGAVLIGGSSKLPGAVDLAKETLGLPAQTGFPTPLGGLVDKVDEPSFATVIGLLVWGMENAEVRNKSFLTGKFLGKISGNVGEKAGNIKKWLEKFLP